MAPDPLDDVAQASRDLAHITIGLGVLTFQKAQVQRRAIERALATQRADRPGSSLAAPLDLIRRSLQQLRDCH